LLQVLGSLVGGRSSSRNSPKRCEACRKEQAGKSTSFKDKPNSSQQQQHQCPHKHVQFSETVAAVYIPVHREYSNRVRQSYWASAGEIREMVYRNMLEFDAEGYSWRHVAEEEDMYFCEETKEFIHPVFFDTPQEEGVSDDATVAVDGNAQVCIYLFFFRSSEVVLLIGCLVAVQALLVVAKLLVDVALLVVIASDTRLRCCNSSHEACICKRSLRRSDSNCSNASVLL
jgi:hypothetical protein